jgi:hypothetical protein
MKRCQPGHLPSRGGTLRARAQVTDPEARYRRYCKDFGKKGYTNPSNGTDWMHQAPQVRVRMPSDRGKEQLGELTVLNERLAGHQAWQARKRVEYLKGKRKAWESVYEVACKHETAMTLNSLETAILEVWPFLCWRGLCLPFYGSPLRLFILLIIWTFSFWEMR